ncbi:MAG: RNA polymerase sigma factor [Phycisphaerae bacterium]
MDPSEFIQTTTELLAGLHESGNRAAWDEFDRRYRPILVAFLRRMGLHDADAADVAQDTLACFVQDYRARKYDRAQGRLRSWLIGIARCRLVDLKRRTGRRRELRGESAIVELADSVDIEAVWDGEEKRHIFQQAVQELRRSTQFHERTLEAFERVVFGREPVHAVAGELGLKPQEIYNAKNRVIERLRAIVARYEAGWIGA